MEKEKRGANRLQFESSPYLLAHKFNPIDWYAWSDEPFQVAKSQDKPIFLSIGYASCHWCHVMEEESFEDDTVAKLLNTHFISIKVDREEHPHIDHFYMECAQSMLEGRGGWPLTLVLGHDKRPFFAETYMPKHSNMHQLGLMDVLQQIIKVWQSSERSKLFEYSDQIVLFVQSMYYKERAVTLPDIQLSTQCAATLFKVFDPIWGGIRGAPKFPMPMQLLFLLSYYKNSHNMQALTIVEHTLQKMSEGGIYDHLGGGFCRYSVDEEWHIPHFEKMLYDNALLLECFALCYQETKKPHFQQIIIETIRFLKRELQSEDTLFYAALDADTEKVEGLYYTWTSDEFREILGKDSEIVSKFFSVHEDGDIEGRCVLHTSYTIDEFCEKYALNKDDTKKIIEQAKRKLLHAREKRTKPSCDDHCIVSWNGLLLHAYIEVAKAFFDTDRERAEQIKNEAVAIFEILLSKLFVDDRLYHSICKNKVSIEALLEDYAALIAAALSLFEIGAGEKWLSLAVDLVEIVEELFCDNGVYLRVSKNTEKLFQYPSYADGSEPSGNSLHAENCVKLYQITFDQKYLNRAEAVFKAAKSQIEHYPVGFSYLVKVLMRYYDTAKRTIIIVLNNDLEWKEEIESLLIDLYFSHHVIVWKKNSELSQFHTSYVTKNDKTTVYICRENACEKVLSTLDEITVALESLET